MLITPYLVNLKKAKEIMLLGEAMDAREAQQAGLVNRVVPDGEFEAAAEAMARKLAALPQNTIRLDKALTNRIYELAGFAQGIGWQQEASLRALAGAHDEVAAERQRIRDEQGWAKFKAEKDTGYTE